MRELFDLFEDRLAEIETYLDFLESVEAAIRSGVPRVGGEAGPVVTAQQQRILYSGVYLQLYNLVEATITGCLDAVSKVAMQRAQWAPGDLTKELRGEWVKNIARTNIEMGPDKRLEGAIVLCDHLVSALPVNAFDIEKGGGGNWDDTEIAKVAKRIGCEIKVSKRTYDGVKRIVRDDLGAMALIVSLRNSLAHGRLSFAECGQDDTAAELRILTGNIADYLREVVSIFVSFIEEHKYLRVRLENR
jgi:hypothetical protein